MAEVMIVGISDWRLAHSPDRLRSLGLGSCVGIVLYCRRIGLAAMAHVMLPDHTLAKSSFHPAKFADTAIPGLVDMLMQHGASLLELEAKMAGGAEMFPMPETIFPPLEKEILRPLEICLTVTKSRLWPKIQGAMQEGRSNFLLKRRSS